jgi:hypothetical protein
MYSIVIKLDPHRLANPNLDLRYVLPDFLEKRSGGLVHDDGYDYGEKTAAMFVYLTTEHLTEALPIIIDVVENGEVMGNRLKDAVIVAVGEYDNY